MSEARNDIDRLMQQYGSQLLVMRLPEKYREVIVLRCYQSLRQKEIAAALHISDRAVRLRLQKANTLLRERLKHRHGQVRHPGLPQPRA